MSLPTPNACRGQHLKSLGYRIALDDFVFTEPYRPLVELADFIKLDYRALGDRGFAEQVDLLRGCRARLLAEKIESEAEFRWCRRLGCQLFQGYYLRKPEVLAGRRIPPTASPCSPCSPSAPTWKARRT